MKFQRANRGEPEVNLTPLIDVVFLLLIFFMVSTTFERKTEISVELPEATGEQQELEQKVVEVTIDAEGHYYVDGQELINTQLETLKRALRKAAGDAEEPQLILSADRKATHESVISAMDAARQVGLYNMTFATRQPAEEQ
ncbi:ExbD/TolR family protein [Thiohalomonas denitrificans]|uniref:Biopolymer transport protein ExbD n=1 Tax=Thiohalomonas denitrificans TaxID=415747 RepID=A0A1G5R121_9GAMM|nr:biopolymer transporter ExbD [Thiohalomonas denitrificans]SCZ67763.1 biopolymer transport protein ExbD [Thiohalomonas denitrificans]